MNLNLKNLALSLWRLDLIIKRNVFLNWTQTFTCEWEYTVNMKSPVIPREDTPKKFHRNVDSGVNAKLARHHGRQVIVGGD